MSDVGLPEVLGGIDPVGVRVEDHPARPLPVDLRLVHPRGGRALVRERPRGGDQPAPDPDPESAIDTIDGADDKRIEIILDRLGRGMPVPVPRPPI